MIIKLYTTQHCSMCKMLKELLTNKKIEFETVEDLDEMEKKGFKSVPMLEVDGKIMNTKEAFAWIKTL